MLNKLLTREYTFLQYLIVLAIVSVFVILYILLLKYCRIIKKDKVQKKDFFIKSAIAGIAPCVYIASVMINKPISNMLFIIFLILSCAVIFLWNFKELKIPAAIPFSILHVITGLMMGILVIPLFGGIFSFVLEIAAIAVIVLFLKNYHPSQSDMDELWDQTIAQGNNGLREGDVIEDLSTGETFYVEKGVNGNTYVRGSDNVLRGSGNAGRFIGNDGHEYIKR